jgi:AcrR family transcriptional regulator
MPRHARRPPLARTRSRKQPSQQRAKKTVDAVLSATRRILETEGFDRVTTNRVAEVANVSIGSVYQYFPSREALIGAAIDRHTEETLVEVQDLAANLAGKSLRESVGMFVDLYVERCRALRVPYRAMLPNLELVRRYSTLQMGSQQTAELVAFCLAGYPEVKAPDLRLAGFVLVTALEGLLSRAVTTGDDALLDDPRLAPELTTLVLGYLTRAREA